MKEKNESAISRQTDAQRKMNACGSFETEQFFCLDLSHMQRANYCLYSSKSFKSNICD